MFGTTRGTAVHCIWSSTASGWLDTTQPPAAIATSSQALRWLVSSFCAATTVIAVKSNKLLLCSRSLCNGSQVATHDVPVKQNFFTQQKTITM